VVRGLKRRSGREIDRGRRTHHVGLTASVHGNGVCRVDAAAAQVGRVHQCGACGVELGHEGVAAGSAGSRVVRGLECAGGWKVSREGNSCDVGVTRAIYGNGRGAILLAAAEIGGVDERRIDHELATAIVIAQRKGEVSLIEHVMAVDLVPRSIGGGLVGERPELAQDRFVHLDRQIAAAVQRDRAGPLDAEFDLSGIGARRDDEIVFQSLWIAVDHPVDPRIDVLIADRGIVADVAAPPGWVIADKVVADAAQQALGAKRRSRAGVLGAQPQGRCPAQAEERPLCGDRHGVSRAACQVRNFRRGLADVGFEANRQLAVARHPGGERGSRARHPWMPVRSIGILTAASL